MNPSTCLRRTALIGVLLLIGAFPARGVTDPCDDPATDPWVAQQRDRVQSYDGLAALAASRYGPPLGCDGRVTSEFDGARYGVVVLTHAGGVTLSVESQPPETSLVTLRHPAGFADEAAIIEAVRAYAAGRGLRVDWSTAEHSEQGGERVETYWDGDPGLNASASLVYAGDRLVAVRVSMAL